MYLNTVFKYKVFKYCPSLHMRSVSVANATSMDAASTQKIACVLTPVHSTSMLCTFVMLTQVFLTLALSPFIS